MTMEGAFVLQHEYEDENKDEQVKFIGVYTTRENAEEAIDKLRKMPGFSEYPDGFSIDFYDFNRTWWAEGFVHIKGEEFGE